MATRKTFIVAAVLGAAVGSASAQSAEEMAGWCFPGDNDGCIGEPVPLRGRDGGFYTCEEKRALTNPVRVCGMKARLFAVECRGDSANYDYRMLFMLYEDAQSGEEKGLVLLPTGPVQLERC
jgi:hypothetical protein